MMVPKKRSPVTVDFLSTEFYQMLRRTCEPKSAGKKINRFLFLSPDQTSKVIATELFTDSMKCPVKSVYPGNILGKYIGETEKNLVETLRGAEHHDLILYFEEGDQLFEKNEMNDTANITSAIFKKADEFNCFTIFDIKKLKTAEKIKSNFDYVVRFPYLSTQVRKMFWKLKQLEALQPSENGDLKPAAEG